MLSLREHVVIAEYREHPPGDAPVLGDVSQVAMVAGVVTYGHLSRLARQQNRTAPAQIAERASSCPRDPLKSPARIISLILLQISTV